MSDSVFLSVNEALRLADTLRQSGNAREADQMFRRVLDAVPEQLDALHFYGVFCHQQGRLADAERQLRRVLELAPDNADAWSNLGNLLQSSGRLEDAERHYRQAIAINPTHPSAHSNLGVVLAATGRHEDSVTAYRKAAELDPGSADFRCNLGNALRRTLKLDEAVTAYQEALGIDTAHHDAWNGLAQTFRMAGRNDLAAQVFRDWLRFRPGDPAIEYLLEACCGENTPPRAPDAYVRQMFDQFADKFDSHLQALDYRAPELVCGALAAALPPPREELEILDAGCGTGLCGPHLAPYASNLTGIDLSSGMLAKADEREVYDSLVQAELTEYIGRHHGAFDAVVSSDTLCYFGDLDPVFASVSLALRPGGQFAFTLEAAEEEGAGMTLNPTGRYMHRRSYVVNALAAAGLDLASYASHTLRTEGRIPVAGHVVVAVKPAG